MKQQVIILLLIFSCSIYAQENNDYRTYEICFGDTNFYYHKTGDLGLYYVMKERIPTGFYKVYLSDSCVKNDSTLFLEGLHINGQPHKIIRKYFQGIVSEEEHYLYGKKEGETKYYYADSSFAILKYVNDTLVSSQHIKNNWELLSLHRYFGNGDYYLIDYYQNGRIRRVATGNKELQSESDYNEDGTKTSESISATGKILPFSSSVAYNKIGAISYVTTYTDKNNSEIRCYRENGMVKYAITKMNGVNMDVSYDENGKLIKPKKGKNYKLKVDNPMTPKQSAKLQRLFQQGKIVILIEKQKKPTR